VSTITASFKTIMGQITEMSQRKKTQMLPLRQEARNKFVCVIDRDIWCVEGLRLREDVCFLWQ